MQLSGCAESEMNERGLRLLMTVFILVSKLLLSGDQSTSPAHP